MSERKQRFLDLIDQWLVACRTGKAVSRNTIAAAIVALDHLRRECPVEESHVFSAGGELIGARATLGTTLERYGVPQTYLKEVTTRQAGTFARKLFVMLSWGKWFDDTPELERDQMLASGIARLAALAHEWLARKNLRINCDRQFSPAAWIESILQEAKGKSGGKVEQHLIGAKLERRFPRATIPNNPGHAGDAQTGRPGDFALGNTVYHVTTAPSLPVIEKCSRNLASGQRPILLVPRSAVQKAVNLAETQNLDKRILIAAIEEFIALNIVEMAEGRESEFLTVLHGIIEVYNRRLHEVETDLSLQIEIH